MPQPDDDAVGYLDSQQVVGNVLLSFAGRAEARMGVAVNVRYSRIPRTPPTSTPPIEDLARECRNLRVRQRAMAISSILSASMFATLSMKRVEYMSVCHKDLSLLKVVMRTAAWIVAQRASTTTDIDNANKAGSTDNDSIARGRKLKK